uniref:CP2 domain-containing protein n=1 Tax=Ganoderma boninense TaxID=34458 RepID=A0A5K1JVM9_9APHY|nr:CP2 domain-containing protein [Ganoderma boninense]
MKSVFAALALVASAYAQGIKIAAPAANSHIVMTKTVLIDNSHTPSTDVAVLIGLRSCGPSGDCDAIADSGALGTVLYKGMYEPISRTSGGSMYQNYTVAVPDGFGTGSALLSVAHFYAGGVANSPTIDTAYIVVQVDSA